ASASRPRTKLPLACTPPSSRQYGRNTRLVGCGHMRLRDERQHAAIRVDVMTDAHASSVLAIYQAGIDEGNATFETQAPSWQAFSSARLPRHRYVAIAGAEVGGWVAASAVSSRPAYAGVVEHSVY